jgi:hypothetical protein
MIYGNTTQSRVFVDNVTVLYNIPGDESVNESIFCSKYMSLYIACGNVMVVVDKSTICKDRR